MQTVKKYGRSLVQHATSAKPSRTIILNSERKNNAEIAILAKNPEFIIANWISMIDKIFTKPNGKKIATKAQYQHREQLGNQCWELIRKIDAIKSSQPDEIKRLMHLFNYKLHPYLTHFGTNIDDNFETAEDKIAKINLYGRRCSAFTGIDARKLHPVTNNDRLRAIPDTDFKFDYAQIAQKIREHLNAKIVRNLLQAPKNESPSTTGPITGMIDIKISSVAKNFHEYDKKPRFTAEDAALSAYFDNNRKDEDVAEQIYGKLKTINMTDNPIISYSHIAAQILQDHSKAIFNADTISAAKIENPELFQVQEAVKAYYKSLFTPEIGKDKRDIDGKRPNKAAKILERAPKDNAELRRMIENIVGNRDLASKLRLGKVIFYQLLDHADANKTAPDWTNLPDKTAIAQSRYWQTAGQTAIKRNESLVRVWRQVTVYANHSLKQWGDPENNIPGDIFGDNETKTAVNNWQIHDERLHSGLMLILGHQHENIFSPEFDKKFAQQKNLLEWSLNSWANLRHKGFHFNGRDKFIQMLSGIELPKDADAKDALTKLWQTDQSARQMRLKDALLGSHCEDYLTQDQLRKIYTEVTPEQPSELPMPRFNRILTRVENKKAWHKFNLPKPAKERLLNKSPALLCQYSCLKMLYQSGFLNWFAQISPASLRNWIEIAVKAADDEAKALNENKTSKIYGQFIQAKSRKIGDVAKVENFTLNEFLFYLSGQTAAEFQVQKNVYHSNGEKAMEQAAYLENIKCDVLIQAFAEYLNAKDSKGANFAFLLKLSQESVKIAHQSQVKNLSVNLAPASGEDWQKSLYFMLHFVPAGFASTLYHQLKKWHILADKGDLPAHQDRNKSDPDTKLFKQLAAVMVLYLDMHDANFDGTGAPTGSEKLIDLFEDKRAFQRVFPNVTANPNASQQAGEKSITLPRGLREFLRFGFHGKIMDSLQNSKITHQDLDRLAELQPKIDKTQQSLDKIHLDWADAEKKKDFGRYHQNDLKDYERHLKLQSEYRQLKNRVNLTYHLHLHQLLMEILARLVDYASLWERDQIFLLLALAHQHGHSSMNDFFSVITDENGRVQDGFALFADGRVVEARDNLVKTAANKNDPKLTAFAQKLDKFIPLNQRNKRSNRSIRNYFMHFNMLRDKKPKANKVPVKEPLDLMSWLNQARELMSYDRKLKNAVAKSIIELFERHNISIGWDADADHQLINPRLKNQRITHLGGLTIIQTGGKHDKKGFKITEWMHNEDYLKMICAMLNIAYIPPPPRVKK